MLKPRPLPPWSNCFKDSVDDYLEFCKGRGEKSDKPFTGKFVVRLSPELHRKIYIAAMKSGESINTWLNKNLAVSLVPALDNPAYPTILCKPYAVEGDGS